MLKTLGLAACLQARVLASEYWRGRAPAAADADDARRRTPPADPHSNTSTPLVDELPDAARQGNVTHYVSIVIKLNINFICVLTLTVSLEESY